jgi:hypothetical protein
MDFGPLYFTHSKVGRACFLFFVGLSAELRVTEHRTPCYELGIEFGRQDIIKRFLMISDN